MPSKCIASPDEVELTPILARLISSPRAHEDVSGPQTTSQTVPCIPESSMGFLGYLYT
jgi:hypothetical protein